MQWRNWRLPVKLAAVLTVPALLGVASSVVQIQHEVASAEEYADIQQLVELRGDLTTLIGGLRQERTLSAENLGDRTPLDRAALRRQALDVDHAGATVRRTAGKYCHLDQVSKTRYDEAGTFLRRLPALRGQVNSGRVAVWSATEQYNAVIKSALDLDQALVNQFGDPQLSRPATASYDLEVAQEQISLQHVLLLEAARRGSMEDRELSRALQDSDTRMRDKLADFRALATPAEEKSYEETVTGADVKRRAQLVKAALSEPEASDGPGRGTSWQIPVKDWKVSSERTGELMDKAQLRLAHDLRTVSARLQDQTSDRAGAASVILLTVLLLAVGIGVLIGRYLLRSLVVLRSTALDVAEHRLPAAVANIREGRTPNAVVESVPVHTTEEFGELARAFEAVHGQAVRLAVEQATLRSDLRNTLVNLSRRSQSLVERQLRLMEQLERHEEDPDQLANLFKLDHLATRMRRNNENLLVLSGSELARRFDQLVPLGNVLRAAVSEIEHYQRVVVQLPAPLEVIGYAAGDLARLVAELMDNATSFSPPDTEVVIGSSRRRDGSALIDILDQGIGMNDAELAEANRRVAVGSSADVPTSRQMGLFVVGRLATRHGIGVKLTMDQKGSGLRALVLVPAGLVKDEPSSTAGQAGTPLSTPDTKSASRVAALRATDTVTAPPLPRRGDGRVVATARVDDSAPTSGPNPDAAEPDRLADTGSFATPSAPCPPTPPVTEDVPDVTPDAPDVTDSGPANGTLVNGTPVNGHPLQDAVHRPVPPTPSGTADPRAAATSWFRPAAPERPGAGPQDIARAPAQPAANAGGPAASQDTDGFSWFAAGSARPPAAQPVDLPQPQPTAGPSEPAAPRRSPAAEPAGAAEAADHTRVGLPKRVPRANLAAGLAVPRAGGVGDVPVRDDVRVSQDAGRTRGFLDSYQAGIRQARPDET
ncbi:nitrate- and nitrite sensing domain-containing protein [Streptomyces sp. BHT-5-2]|uniref:nitrate- and nitrite sensing domain-containing protein n=1 Tax=Streptomyces sp. BHT-5-2 TaxID=2866715 RepID=UPI001C8E6B0F|nr:nitrate- and nitrite sensing domain-containing protein [Streptomyces sp. BHT-5-2]QZL04363.1 nitrate- and nitrite sensing domain-containing protein [Streptomyces sp. BHT-5-2]